MKDIKALLDLANDTFEAINFYLNNQDYQNAYHLVREKGQLPEWILTGKSDIDGKEYGYNDLELIEGLMHRLFDWTYKIISVHTLNDKGRFATTAVVEVMYRFSGEAKYRRQGGVATVFCGDIKGLTLASPQAASKAKRNACKYIGKLLGLDLNREQEELPIVQVKPEDKKVDEEIEKELQAVTNAIKAAATKELASAILNQSPFKLYPQLKELVNQKIN